MNRRSILKLLGLAPVAAPAVAAITPASSAPVHEKIVTPHAKVGPRSVALEAATGSCRAHATSADGPAATHPMRVRVGADGRVLLTIEATPLGRDRLRLKRNGQHIWMMPSNFSCYYSDEQTVRGEPTRAHFADRPGPGEHTYTLECDTGGEVALIAMVA